MECPDHNIVLNHGPNLLVTHCVVRVGNFRSKPLSKSQNDMYIYIYLFILLYYHIIDIFTTNNK